MSLLDAFLLMAVVIGIIIVAFMMAASRLIERQSENLRWLLDAARREGEFFFVEAAVYRYLHERGRLPQRLSDLTSVDGNELRLAYHLEFSFIPPSRTGGPRSTADRCYIAQYDENSKIRRSSIIPASVQAS